MSVAKKIAYLVLGFCILFFACTPPSPLEELEVKLIEYGSHDDKIDAQEMQQLMDFVVGHERHRDLRQFFSNGSFAQSKFVEYIKARGYAVEDDTAKNMAINIYIENSGSMNGYVQGNTQFKDDFRDLLVLLKNGYGEERIKILFINSAIHPTGIEVDLIEIPSKLNPSSIKVGSTAASELNTIFKQVLANTSEDTTSILLSDCIYSVGKGETLGLLNAQRSLTKDAFLTKFKEGTGLSTVIVKMNSVFRGTYYDKNDRPIVLGSGKVERPYYFTVIGGNDAIADFNAKIELSKDKVKGFDNRHTFSAQDYSKRIDYLPVKAKSDNGSWKSKSNGIEDIKVNRRANEPFSISVIADLSDIPVSEDYISNREHYRVTKGDYSLIAIKAYDEKELTPQSANQVGKSKINPTHLLEFRATSKNYTNLVFSLKRQLPQWVHDTHTDDDTDIHKTMDKTFGFRYLVEGIAEAYETVSELKGNYFEITININK